MVVLSHGRLKQRTPTFSVPLPWITGQLCMVAVHLICLWFIDSDIWLNWSATAITKATACQTLFAK